MRVSLQHTVQCSTVWLMKQPDYKTGYYSNEYSPNVVLLLGQRLRRWPNIEPALHKCTMFEGKSSFTANTKHLYNIYTTSAQRLRRWSNIVQSHTNVLCSQGVGTRMGSTCFEIPTVIQSVCLQSKAQLRSRTKGFEIRWNCYS